MAQANWQPVPGTANWHLPEEGDLPQRHIVVREPRIGESDGTKYEVSGPGHHCIYSSCDEAKAAAQASRKPSEPNG
jgi:hypothetical protein